MKSALHYPASNSTSSGGFVESARTARFTDAHTGMIRHLSDQVAFSQSLDLHRSVVSPEGLRPWKDG